MSKIHIGKKIKEMLDKNPMSVVEFAESIGLTRNGAYKVFEKETIDTGQLQKIGKVLDHNFFQYYGEQLSIITVKEGKTDYGFATKHDLDELTHIVKNLAREFAKMREEMPDKKKPAKKYSKAKK